MTNQLDILLLDFKSHLLLEKSLSENTVNAYLNDVNKLFDYLSIRDENVEVTEVKRVHIEGLMATIHSMGLSAFSQSRILSGIRSFYNFLQLSGKVAKNPLQNFEAPKLSAKLPTVLSVVEVFSIVNSIDLKSRNGLRNRAILEVLYSCGLRVSEVVNMRLSCYYPFQNYIRIIGKNNRERIVPIGKNAINYLNRYINEIRCVRKIDDSSRDIIFLGSSGKMLSRVMIFLMIKKQATKAGLIKNVSPHTFRHSFATHLLEGGANLRAIQDMLGHESITTTERYTHLDTKYLEDTVNNFHPRNKYK